MPALVDSRRGPPAASGHCREQVADAYQRQVLVPAVLAMLLVPFLGPVSMLFDLFAQGLSADSWATYEAVQNGLLVVELAAGGALFLVALVGTARLGRRYAGDRRDRVSNGARAWHAWSIALLVLLALVPAGFLVGVLALSSAFSVLTAGP